MQPTNEMMLCGSFAKKAGSFGTLVHTAASKYYGLNFAYKAFSVDDIGEAIKAMRTLKIRGVGISMPYKIEVMKHIDDWSIEVSCVGAVNTVVNEDGKLVGHNTDWIAAHSLLARVSKASGLKNVCILGNGGYAKAVAHASRKLDLEYWHLCRNSWESIPNVSNAIVFNCTPVENIEVDGSNAFIDCITTTPSGKELAVIQAGEQFKLYTGKDFPLHFLKRAGIV